MNKYELILTEEQAKIVSEACEFYARVKMGQFDKITEQTLDFNLETEDYCRRRDQAESLLLEARQQIYPELYGVGHSYGIGKFKDADIAFGTHQVLRKELGICSRPAFSFQELPVCKKI